MLGKKSKPVIGILTGSFISGNRSKSPDTAMSPRSVLDGPRGLKNYDQGAVGLGLAVALEKSGDSAIPANKALFSRNLSRTNMIPINSPRNLSRFRGGFEENEVDGLEDYTIVTCHDPNKSFTKVYYDGRDHHARRGDDEISSRIQQSLKSTRSDIFHISPVRSGDSIDFPMSDFLSSCHLCQKKLHGKDIYMYRGEKAFCSTECRYRQIVMDERAEKCSAAASRSVDLSSSPCTNGQIFSTGILAI